MRLVLQNTTFITLLLLESNKRNKENTALSRHFSFLNLTLLHRLSGLASFNSPINYESDLHRVVSVPVTDLLYFQGERFYSLFGHRKTKKKKPPSYPLEIMQAVEKRRQNLLPELVPHVCHSHPWPFFLLCWTGTNFLLHDSPRNAWCNPGEGSAQHIFRKLRAKNKNKPLN